jgi:signal transduction histidine kinase
MQVREAEQESQRETELARYSVLTTSTGQDIQSLVDLVAQVCEVPTAAINIISRDHQHQIAATGLDPGVCSRDDSMCSVVLDESEAVVVSDAVADPRFADNAFVNGTIGRVRFYASAPLLTPDGMTLGRLCVFDEVPRTLTPQQRDALMTLAAQVMDVLELRYRSRALEQSLVELTAARDELRRSNRDLALFAGQVSHDLRSPLTAILANAEMLASEPAVEIDPTLSAMVEAMTQAGQRMNRMIEEMLGFASEGGQPRLDQTSPRHIMSLVLTDLAPNIAETGAEVVVGNLAPVVADADMLYSILLNLVSNALKFARPGVPPRVEIDAARTADRWRLTVRDNGVGIAPERRDAVFTLFARGAGEVSGHGIGLATTRRLVEAHGGQAGADASDLGGAAMWVELPAS